MELVSCIPGRIRVKYNDLYRNRALASQLYNELYNIDSVYFVKINIYTGKLLIVYDKNILSLEDLLSRIESFAKIDYEDDEEYTSTSNVFIAKSESNHRSQQIDKKKSIPINNNSNEKIVPNKPNFENSVMKFYDSISPIIVMIAIMYSLSITNFTPLLAIVFLLTFNSLNKSTSIVLDSISKRLHNNGIHLISLSKLDEISNLSTIIIDKTQDTSDLETSFIENLREHGFYDIHIFTTNFNIESQAKSLDLTTFRVGDNDLEKITYINSLKKDNETIALISNDCADAKVLNAVDIGIRLSNEFRTVNDEPWDLIINNNNFDTLGETIDYIKYALEKIYQNQLISLWLNILGIILSFSKNIKLIYIGVLSIVNEILVYINSLRLLNYEPIYE